MSQRLQTARVACLVTVGLLTGFALFGQTLLSLLGISSPLFKSQAALFCYWSPSTRCARTVHSQETAAETAAGTSKDDIAIPRSPFPMLAGPAAIPP